MLKVDLGIFSAKIVFGSPFTDPREFVGYGQGELVPELLCHLSDNVADFPLVPAMISST